MQITRPLTLAVLLLLNACASTPGMVVSQEPPQRPLRGGIAEFSITSYDGRNLKGRVLLGATIDPLVIDGRLVENSGVELREVRECGKTDRLGHWLMESLFSPRPDQIVTLPKGYWHGANMNFFLWSEAIGLGPDCFETKLVLHVLDGRVAATLPIKVVRTDKPSATPTGATEEPKTPAPEGRAP